MECQIQELIDKIKKDGISTAEQKAAEILSDVYGSDHCPVTLELDF